MTLSAVDIRVSSFPHFDRHIFKESVVNEQKITIHFPCPITVRFTLR